MLSAALLTAASLRTVLYDRIGKDLSEEAQQLALLAAPALADGDDASVVDLIATVDMVASARVLVVDASGRVVAITSGPPPSNVAGAQSRLLEAVRGQRPFAPLVFQEGRGGEVLSVEQPVYAPNQPVQLVGAVRASYNVEDVQDTLTRQNATALFGAVGAALLAASVGLLFAVSIARPVRQVARAAGQLAAGRRLDEPLPETRGSTEELRALVQSFNSLAQQLLTHEEARRSFASDVSHELHSLASAMQTAAEALDRGAAESNPDLGRRLVAGLVGHTRRLNRLADDLLELGRFEGGRLNLQLENVDVVDLVEGVAAEWAADAERLGMALELRLPDRRDRVTLRADPVRLGQALGNLVENALKYTGGGGRVGIDVTLRRQLGSPACYEIAVADSGPGIPPDVLPRVFDRYFRVEGRAGGGPGGMGLGLAIARGIAQAHGGDLVAESPSGGGARFVLTLPVGASASATTNGGRSHPGEPASETTSRGRAPAGPSSGSW